MGNIDINKKILTSVREKFGVQGSVFEENNAKQERKRA